MGINRRASYCNEPTPAPAHQRAAAELITELTLAVRKSNCKKCHVYDPLDFKNADDTILVPDILIICGDVTKKYLDFPPSLVVEILPSSTALRNRNTKYQYYQQQGVKYYLIVDIDKKNVKVSLLDNAKYSLQELNTSISFI